MTNNARPEIFLYVYESQSVKSCLKKPKSYVKRRRSSCFLYSVYHNTELCFIISNNMTLFLSFLVLLTSVMGSSLGSSIDNYFVAFAKLKNDVVWPTPSSNSHNISSTFGPRLRASCNHCYDFHRGIDIHGNVGDPVVATYHGKVIEKKTYSGGGLTIILEHSFTNWTTLHADKGSIKKWYTLYMHLDSVEPGINVGSNVVAGARIANLGESGSTVNPHLHHEVRVGTRCTLEWAVTNPSSTCNTKGYDPAVHPMLVYPQTAVGIPPADYVTLTPIQDLDILVLFTNGIVRVSTPDDSANINQYVVEQLDANGALLHEHELDLNLRKGYDATSTAALDTPDQTEPYLSPISFGYSNTAWEMDLVVPHTWVSIETASVRVSVLDTWGNMVGTIDL